ncbi:GcrA family cell cycle regulator [Aureimonas glaciei]|nr:GcrA family cell cycle regulator [Aureimonas glaciei]
MGDTVRVIGASLGVSRAIVAGIASARRDLFPRRRPGKQKGVGFWSGDKIVIAAQLWAEGKSTAEVAEHFGAKPTSANALITRNRELFPHRGNMLKQTGMKHPPKAKKPKPAPPAVKPQPAPKIAAAPKPIAAAEPPIVRDRTPKAESFRPLLGAEPMPVLSALIANRCKWPVHAGDDPFTNAATFFCGEQRLAVGPYCAGHHRLAHSSGTPSERSADRVLEFHAGRAA